MKTEKAKLKNKAWVLFSKYIRLKDADKEGMVACVTCKQVRHWQDQMQAGHYLDSRTLSILFEESCVHPQCYQCNCLGGHRGIDVKSEYEKFMVLTYGKEEVDRLKILKKKPKKITEEEYHEMIEDLKDKLVSIDIINSED